MFQTFKNDVFDRLCRDVLCFVKDMSSNDGTPNVVFQNSIEFQLLGVTDTPDTGRNQLCRLVQTLVTLLKNMPPPASICLFYRIKIVHFSGIRPRVVRVEGDHADHLTPTEAPQLP